MTNEQRLHDTVVGVEHEVGELLKPQEPRLRPFVAVTKPSEPEPAEPAPAPLLTVSERLTLLHERLLDIESKIDTKLDLVLAVLK